jgi:hypothetical protein
LSFSHTSGHGHVPIGYCALEYRARDDDSASAKLERIILIADKSETGELRIRVHPDWRTIVTAEDQPMMAELFEDFAERSQRDSESLLQQLSALNVGPLVTYDAGQDISTRADLTELSNSFELI